MRETVGLWIDHRKAVIVSVSGKAKKTRVIESKVEKQLRPDGGPRSTTQYGPQDAPSDDMRETVFKGHLSVYFDKVVACLSQAQSILIFGPGEAKGELKKIIDKKILRAKVIALETADKMTDRQIEAKVRKAFPMA